MDVLISQENTKNVTKSHGYYFYPLYAGTLPLMMDLSAFMHADIYSSYILALTIIINDNNRNSIWME